MYSPTLDDFLCLTGEGLGTMQLQKCSQSQLVFFLKKKQLSGSFFIEVGNGLCYRAVPDISRAIEDLGGRMYLLKYVLTLEETSPNNLFTGVSRDCVKGPYCGLQDGHLKQFLRREESCFGERA